MRNFLIMESSKPVSNIAKGNAVKRKYMALSVLQKLEILKELDRGASVTHLSRLYGVGKTTIYVIKRQREKLLRLYTEVESDKDIVNCKSTFGTSSAVVDRLVYDWFKKCLNERLPVSGPLLCEKAKQFHKELKISEPCDFTAGWLHRFKLHHGICYRKTCGDKPVMERQTAENYVNKFNKLVRDENLSPEQIYNADETGHFWCCIPKSMLAAAGKHLALSKKDAMERVTMLVCANAAGTHKCRLFVVGERKGVKVLPVIYKNNRQALLTKELSTEWFEDKFVLEAREHCHKVGLPMDCKIILLLNYCSVHPDIDVLVSRNIFATYIPPNCAKLIQPMDLGIIHSLKLNYRREFMRCLVNSDESADGLGTFKKEFNIMNCLSLLSRAWESVTRSTLKNAWNNLWPLSMFIDPESENNFEGFRTPSKEMETSEWLQYSHGKRSESKRIFHRDEYVQWMNYNKESPRVSQMTNSEIFSMMKHPKRDKYDNDNEESHEIPMECGIAIGENYIRFLEQKSFITQQEIMNVYCVQEKLVKEKPKLVKFMSLQEQFNEVSEHCELPESTTSGSSQHLSTVEDTAELQLVFDDDLSSTSTLDDEMEDMLLESPVASTSAEPDAIPSSSTSV